MATFLFIAHVCALVIGLFGAVFLAVAQATNSWLLYDANELRVGLYQRCEPNNCTFLAWTLPLPRGELVFFITRIILLGADFFALCALFFVLIAFIVSDHRKRTWLRAAGAFMIIAGILTLAAAIVFTVFSVMDGRISSYHYGYIFPWVGGCLLCTAGIVAVVSASKTESLSGSSFPVMTKYRPSQNARQNPAYNPEFEKKDKEETAAATAPPPLE